MGRSDCCPGASRDLDAPDESNGSADDELAVAHVDLDGVALGDLSLEDERGESIADLALDHALERTRAERGIETVFRELRRRCRRDHQRDASRGQALAQMLDLDRHD